MRKFLTDEQLEKEDLITFIWILVSVIVVLAGFLIEIELNKPVSCTPDFCMDNFCVIMKGEK